MSYTQDVTSRQLIPAAKDGRWIWLNSLDTPPGRTHPTNMTPSGERQKMVQSVPGIASKF